MDFEQQDAAMRDDVDAPRGSVDSTLGTGFWSGFGPTVPVRGIVAGALEGTSALFHGLPGIARAMANAPPEEESMLETERRLEQEDKEGPKRYTGEDAFERWSQTVEDRTRAAAKAAMPDPRVTGSAANVVFGASKVMTQAAALAAAGGPELAAAGVGYTTGISRYRDLRDQGVDDATASKIATLDGALQAGGMFAPTGLPTSWLSEITPIAQGLTQLSTGAIANLGQGAASRWVTGKILKDAGYDEMAEQSKVWDGQSVAADLLSGAFFGGMTWLGQRGELSELTEQAARRKQIDSQVRDAAKVVQDARSAAIDRAPGVPVDFQSQAAHAAALEKATSDLLADRPVDVSEQTADGATFARPAEDPRIAQVTRDAVLQSFKETGVMDEAANLAELERALQSRYEPKVAPTEREISMPDENGEVRTAEEHVGRLNEQAEEQADAPKAFKSAADCIGASV